MRSLFEFLFPTRLHRGSYFVRLIICNAAMYGLAVGIDTEDVFTGSALALVAVTLYAMFFVLLPRVRDLGMSAWWLVFAPIPFANILLGIILLFRRGGRRLGSSYVQPPAAETAPDDHGPSAENNQKHGA
jgi:hypothetical protein